MTQLSDEVVERVARAMKPELFRRPESECGPVTLYERDFTRSMARAAIAAYEAKGDVPVDEG